MSLDSTKTNGGALARLKGLIWVVGVIAALVTLVSLAPVISHSW
jgi:hypothetical protein